MVHRWFDSLVNRGVALLVVVVVASVVIVTAMNMSASRQELEQQARTQVDMIAGMVGRELDRKLIERLKVLAESAAAPVTDNAVNSDAERVLQTQVAISHLFDRLFLINADGRVRAVYPAEPSIPGIDVSERAYFRDTASALTPSISEPFQSYRLDLPALMVAAPVFDDRGRFTGILSGSVVLTKDNFLSEVGRLRPGVTGSVEVVTRSGKVVVSSDAGALLRNVDASSALMAQALSGEEGTAQVLLNGEETLVSIQQLNMAPWFVKVSWPVEDAYGPALHLGDNLLYRVLLILAFVVPVALWLFRRQMAPLANLSRQIHERHLGVRTEPLDVRGSREIREVAETFNKVMEDRDEVETRLHTEQQRAEKILGALQEGVVMTDTRGSIRYVNAAAEVFLGGHESVIGAPLFEVVSFEVAGQPVTMDRFLGAELVSGLDGQLVNQHGHTLDAELTVLWVERDLATARLVFVIRDDSERRRQEELLSWQATHDALTGLANRRAFTAALVKWLGEARGLGSASVLMMIDLDHFKPVNDQGGHLLGDELLKALADVLRRSVRQSDVVGRMGGDEFAILLPACGLPRAEAIAEQVRGGIEGVRVQREGREFGVTASIGLTTLSAMDAGPREAVARADEAAYAAKAGGRNRVVALPAQDDP